MVHENAMVSAGEILLICGWVPLALLALGVVARQGRNAALILAVIAMVILAFIVVGNEVMNRTVWADASQGIISPTQRAFFATEITAPTFTTTSAKPALTQAAGR
jgi:hypothetical protein